MLNVKRVDVTDAGNVEEVTKIVVSEFGNISGW